MIECNKPFNDDIPMPPCETMIMALNGVPEGVDHLYRFYQSYIASHSWRVANGAIHVEDIKQDVTVEFLRCLIRLRDKF